MSEENEITDFPAPEADNRGQWFVIHAMSGREKQVCDKINNMVKSCADDRTFPVYQAVVPVKTVSTRSADGKQGTRTVKLFPGYVYVRMDMFELDEFGNRTTERNEKAWYAVRGIQGVMGFLGTTIMKEIPGADGGRTTKIDESRPIALTDSEVADLMAMLNPAEEKKVTCSIVYNIGEKLRIRDGAFQGYEGEIQKIDAVNCKLTLIVQIFNRSTPVELDYQQVERIV